MKKFIVSVILFLIVTSGIVYFKSGKEILTLLDEKKVYSIENIQTTMLENLDRYDFFNDGVVTYNNQKIQFRDYNGNLIWENQDKSFSQQVFVTDKYIFRNTENTIQVIDKSNQVFIIAEINGSILNVSRENGKTYMIIKNTDGGNSLYIINDKNEVIMDNKSFEDNITSVSISDKSESYAIITLSFDSGKIVNTVHLNLIDEVELWSFPVEDEILVKAEIVNNNVIAIGTNNVYYFNLNGKLLWKNGVYSKILDYEISKETEKIYMMYSKDNAVELIAYNLEGKVSEINKVAGAAQKLKVYEGKVFVYNESSIYLVHGTSTDKIYEDTKSTISDFTVEGNSIRILSKDKLITGKLK